MPRLLKVAAAQIGAIDRKTPRPDVLNRLIALLDAAAGQGVQFVVFPEIAFTTFFPRYIIRDEVELDSYYERESPENGVVDSPNVAPFFAHARQLGIDVSIGYAEKTPEGIPYNTSCYVSGKSGNVISKYRKVHLPGTLEPFDEDPHTTNQLEKRYFIPGDLGFKAFRAQSLVPRGSSSPETSSPVIGQLICNDRRWSEAWRVYGLQGVEIMCIGFNTTAYAPQLWGGDQSISRERARDGAMFHHKLVVQANAYTNATYCITAARAGWDDGHFELIAGSMIVDPEGHIVAESRTVDDELVVADIDLDACLPGKERTFCFAKHRRPEHYGMIVSQKGVVEPAEPPRPPAMSAPSNEQRAPRAVSPRDRDWKRCQKKATLRELSSCNQRSESRNDRQYLHLTAMPPQTTDESIQQQHQQQRTHPTHYYFEPGGRPFRSRKNRPCDSCRRTKTRCTIGAVGPPCFECVQTKKNCTFEEGPPARKHRTLVIERQADSVGPLHTLANAAASMPTSAGSLHKDHNTTGLMSSGSPDAVGGKIHPSPHSVTSLDLESSEAFEPHVLTAILTDDLLPISTGANHPGAPHARQISTNSQKPVYVVFAPRPDVRTSHDPGVQVLYRVRSLLKALPCRTKEEELLQIYFNRVHPAFPILPLMKNMGEFPPYLLSAIYATAFNHLRDLREMSAAAWSFVHAPNVTDPGIDSPRLSTIAAAVLDIGARPTVDPRGNYLTLAKTIAHAQLLGLHLNPMKWSIPSWEKDLRIRLWWGLRIHDAWMSFLNSRPSHMQVHNTDIPLPSTSSLTSAFDNPNLGLSCRAFSSLCCLADIVARLQNEICTIKSQEKLKEVKLQEVASLERNTNDLVFKWRKEIANPTERQPGVKAVDYIAQLTDDDLEEFWLCYSSHIISSLLSSLIRICLASLSSAEGEADADEDMTPQSTSMASHPWPSRSTALLVDPPYAHAVALHLLSRLTGFLRTARDQGRWDVADPALTRASSVISRLKTWEESMENTNMILALEGHIFPYPVQPMQWQQGVAQAPTPQHHMSPAVINPEMGVSLTPSPGTYAFPQSNHLQHQHTSTPTSSVAQHGYSSPASAQVDQRTPTPPHHVPQMYADAYSSGVYVSVTHNAGQTPPEMDESETPLPQILGPDLDMLGMDGVTFWTPWMSNIGIDGNGNIDETLTNYNFGRPAGW
ncbi:hypothetical protein EW145_g5306 [Phellinidium pouzarii]|uniref:Zn(2)-C6 fungal-type domain-containing protein n=1 Tax=Phellinidium pouzarii TaxID=167371 RepID=A0A4S4L0G1_9AGAM|nr:hypothetical protein EW145_g5306 [Phellinidium pouzarii]